MARVDKTQSAVGVVRAVLGFNLVQADYDKVIGVGIDVNGRIQRGASNSGIVGVIVPSQVVTAAGKPTDIFVLADIVDVAGLTAGTKIYVDNTTGAASVTATNGTYVGFTVEATRLIVRL